MDTDRKARNTRIFSFAVMFYMVAAFTWWAFFLNKKITTSHELNIVLLEKSDLSKGEKTIEFKKIEAVFNRQKRMVLGEGFFFGLSLSISVFLVYMAYRRQLNISKNQTNFLLAVTHELKSPIASVSLILQTLLKHNLGAEKQQELQKNALKETKRLNQLVSNLLLTAQLDATYTPYLEHLNISAIFEKSIAEWKNRYPKVLFTVNTSQNLSILADRVGMKAIADNLLGNSIKYGLSPIEIKINIFQQNKKIIIEVEDNGIGVADSEKKNIFNRFYRSGNEAIRKTKGTGLGLFIVQKIVTAHKGKISVKDNQPSGAIFTVELSSKLR